MTRQWPLRAFSGALSRAYSSSSSSPFPLKHVAKLNFESAFCELKSHVGAADFVAIDLEMTGVTSAPWRESFEYDRYDVRYLKVKDSAEKFAILQFGVCPFRWDAHHQSFIAHPHNFYIFPRQELAADGTSYEFLCQTTSMDFLAKYQFDFNACIHEGVSYLSRRQEEEALKRLNLRYEDNGLLDKVNEFRDVPLARVTDVLFSERMKNRLSEWRDGLLRSGNGVPQFQGISNHSRQQMQTIFYKMRPALSLNGFTAHQLKLIQLVTNKHFKDLAYVRFNSETSCSQQIVVYMDSKSDKDLFMKEVKDDYLKEADMKIKAAIGFRHVIDLLSSAQKLIVGHNCFLDIAHIYSKFFGPLPQTAEGFVSSFHTYFPHIVDTKVLLNSNSVLPQRMRKSNTSLSSAFSLLCPQMAVNSNKISDLAFRPFVNVEVQVDDTRSSNWSSGIKHEAGYDAFMTGCVFAQACSHLGIDFKLHSSSSENLAQNEKLQKYINLLYLSWIHGDIIDLRTGNMIAESSGSNKFRKQHPKILFENVVLIWRFPLRLKATEIRECISKVFGPCSVTSIYHVDETAVFVQFSKAELVFEFLVLKESLERSNDAISVLHPLSKLLEGGNTCAAGYETYKEICSSPISKVLFADQADAVGIRWKTRLVESKLEAQSQKQESFCEENVATTTSISVEKSKTGKQHVIDDLLSRRSKCDEVIDSFFTAEVRQVRATN
ncbi:hypothetical protein P3X46_027334 [Hevea brasiliensis]|uniref:Uncharacterized protein n=1 Tax=Hevea brasiliensis TaxID=3981 RepID=A0ABQ9KZH3_HEVBR|nr:poly(A)-specific ribonuclease PARN [Hevea brasiliensis]KAJ9153948.1 hypothetical protein P3X46_027334 [Hevea brasiliensis]